VAVPVSDAVEAAVPEEMDAEVVVVLFANEVLFPIFVKVPFPRDVEFADAISVAFKAILFLTKSSWKDGSVISTAEQIVRAYISV
jgi:hypothetical protein